MNYTPSLFSIYHSASIIHHSAFIIQHLSFIIQHLFSIRYVMHASALVKKSLLYYWRTNVAVVLGVATAVSVLAGALLVGSSVRASLKDLFLRRLGNTDLVVSGSSYFPEALAERIQSDPTFHKDFQAICPLVIAVAVAIHQESGRRASDVQVYGIDERFWKFHAHAETAPPEFGQRDALVSRSVSEEIGLRQGDSVLLKLEMPSEVPAESLHGRKEASGRTVRLNTRRVLPPAGLGEFSLLPQQGSVHTVFVPLKRLQTELEQESKVNTLLVAGLPGSKDSSD
ncbi:MAG: ABC transporter permease, partial [Pyrinomonadaceae bacterium]